MAALALFSRSSIAAWFNFDEYWEAVNIVQERFPDQMNMDDDYVFGVENLGNFC